MGGVAVEAGPRDSCDSQSGGDQHHVAPPIVFEGRGVSANLEEAARWFERGERVTRESLQSILRGLTQYLLEALRGLGQRRPGRDSLRQRVSEALEQSPMAEDLGEAGKAADAN